MARIFLLVFCLPVFAFAYESAGQKFRIDELVHRKEVIWGFDFLPDGRILFTERNGAIQILDPQTKKVTAVPGAPKVWAKGQGGMLDVRLHPKQRQKVYLSYSLPVGEGATTALGVGRLEGDRLVDFKRLFAAEPATEENIHFGSRIEFDNEGHLFLSVGDRNERKEVQNLGSHLGKVLRFKDDGSVPADNPFLKRKGAKPEVWSYGHRSPQGMFWHAGRKELWLAEMGPLGGDELNLVRAGKNYGWPEATYGREYYGLKIGEKTKAGMEDPVAYWVPSISPSGMALYTGEAFPAWRDNIFLANLSGSHLRRLVLADGKVTTQEVLLKDLGYRFRQVRTGPDGFLYFSTDDGRIGRLVPQKGA